METIEELQQFLQGVTADGVRGQLLDRGTAWSLIRQEGELPADAPQLGAAIETDLAEYGFSVLRAALALRERSDSTKAAAEALKGQHVRSSLWSRTDRPKISNAASIASSQVRPTTSRDIPRSPIPC